MALLFHKLNYTPFFLGGVHEKTTRYRARSDLQVADGFSSVSIQIDAGKSSSQSHKISGSGALPKENGNPLKQENTVGIIGGLSVLSTLIFLEKLVWMSSRNHPNENIPFIVSSDPSLSRVLASNNYVHSFSSRISIPERNVDAMITNLRCKRKFLEQSGARCIVMPCHLSHSWYEEISEGSLLKFFHVGECVADELKEAKLKPLEAGSDVRIGLLASNATLSANFYQEMLQNQGFEVVLPDKANMDHILVPVTEALKRKDMVGAQNLLRIAIQILLMGAVNIVILASDEFQGLLPQNDPLQKKCLDPMDALARSVIKWANKEDKLHIKT
ncbi:uncharacterized protein LOC126655344 [Mercurialis annua]|uniref:uncharacterized protein LOC126655344 n=1 Tax=Mercurialis annua TaxID=3986 RepID=UPI002160034A|nr:uncharacterized protein LOC126655344 [Mercurialis annua]